MDWREHVRLANESVDDSGKVIRECAARAETPTRFNGTVVPLRPKTGKTSKTSRLSRSPALREPPGGPEEDPDDQGGNPDDNGTMRAPEASVTLEAGQD